MSSPQQLVLCHYRYDPLDRLSDHTLAASAPLQRFYCKTRLVTEIDGAISRSIVQHGDQLLAQSETTGTARQATLLATDQQRSVLHAVASSGQQPLAYTPYGHRPAAASYGLLNLLGFNGERPDPVTGHYLLGNGYRAFNPVLMRFNSPDSLSPFGKGGLNTYAYCLGDPINLHDPNGNFSLKVIFSRTRGNARPAAVVATTNTSLPSPPSATFSAPATRDLAVYAPKRSAPGYGRPRANVNTHPNSQATGRRRSLPTASTNAINESQFEPVGYHGSLTKNASSLQNGVIQQGRGGKYGDGFYTSVNRDAALSATPDNADATAFGVWVKNYSGMTPGRDYTTGNWGELTAVAFNMHTYPLIRVDVIRGKFKPVMPRANEAPF
ncbi:RHS repeat-associated core domain-containing protein [Pseudomonas frederiksbergensis]|uniref:RHS repeat-associated core domain-containing protein n=1 Tax=Pseudomonas frederiksbergensis TaxID=104087 RepID=UPI000F48FB2F|nr:RHS repeat-associated core domain-containing protein [Pseudomonas frederiksbergensis]